MIIPIPKQPPSVRLLTAVILTQFACWQAISPPTTVAQDVKWINTTNRNALWQFGSNWSTGSPPGPAGRAIFSQPANYQVWWDTNTESTHPTVGSIDVVAGEVMFRNLETTVVQHTVLNDLTISDGTLTNFGLNLKVGGNTRIAQNGKLLIDGSHQAGSRLISSGETVIDEGSLIFDNGATGELADGLKVGLDNGNTAIANILGGSTVQASGQIAIGSGTNQLSTSDAQLNISGAGSKLTYRLSPPSGSFVVGNSAGLGTHTLLISDGGVLDSDISATISDSAELFVDNGTFLSSSSLHVHGSALMSNGGTVTVNDAILDFGGQAVVTGNGTTWSHRRFTIGHDENGTLTIEDQGTVTSGSSIIGDRIGSSGQVTVSGNGSSWTTDLLDIGQFGGSGNLMIQSGGSVSSLISRIATSSGSAGAATVTGTGSTWQTGSLNVGNQSQGSLEILDGGSVISSTASIGVFDIGHVTVSGNGSSWTNQGFLNVGFSGVGTLQIDNGAHATINGDSRIGFVNNSSGVVTVNGATTGWTTTGDLTVGRSGSGVLNIENFASVIVGGTTSIGAAGAVHIESGRFEFGTIDASDSSRINASGGKLVGNVSHNGVTDVESLTLLQNPVFDSSELVLVNSGVLLGTAVLSASLENQSSGELRSFNGDWIRFENVGNLNSGEINNFGGTVEFAQQITNTVDGFMAGRGQFIAGGGWTNEGVMAFSGTTDILGDVQNIASGRIVTSGGATTTIFDDLVHNGQEIRTSAGSKTVIFGAATGAGSYTGTGTVFFEGDLRPGNSPASVLFEGDVVLGSGAITFFELGGQGNGRFDQMLIAGDLSLDGQLTVALIDAFRLTYNDEFLVADVGGTSLGQFSGLDEGDLVDSFNGMDLFITYAGGDGNDVVLFTAVPEPSIGLALGLMILGLVVSGRRRRYPPRPSAPNHVKPARCRTTGVVFVVVAGITGLTGQGSSAQTTTWLGGAGNWFDSANWDNGVPSTTTAGNIDNGNPASSDVFYSGSSDIEQLSIDAGDQLRLGNGSRLRFEGFNGLLNNNGMIQHEGTGFTWIEVNNDLTIDGTGTIRLNGGSNAITGFNNSGPPLLVHGAAHTIEGGGSVGSGIDVVNHGLIHANLNGAPLTIDSSNEFRNDGIVRASNGGFVNLFSQSNSGTGVYEAVGAGSFIQLFGGSITNATLNTTAGGVIRSDSMVDIHDLTNQGQFQIQQGRFLGSLDNSGTVRFLNGSNLNIELGSDLTVSGGGVLDFVQGGPNVTGNILFDNTDNTITGFGHFESPTIHGATSTISPVGPNDSTSLFDFHRDATFNGAAVFELEGLNVDGSAQNINQVNTSTNPGQIDFDQLNVFGVAAIGESSVFEVNVINGFQPEPGDFFDIMTGDQISVQGSINFDFPVIDGLTFEHSLLTLPDPTTGTSRDVLRITYGATVVPEPSSGFVFGLGVCFTFVRSRFRRAQHA